MIHPAQNKKHRHNRAAEEGRKGGKPLLQGALSCLDYQPVPFPHQQGKVPQGDDASSLQP